MKFGVTTYLLISNIIASIETRRKEDTNLIIKFSDESLDYISEFYKPSDQVKEFHNAIKNIMNYICQGNNKIDIKMNTLQSIENFLQSKEITLKQKEILDLMIKDIKKGNALEKFTQSWLDYIIFIYYHINIADLSAENKNNKSNFERILSSQSNITSLNIVFPLINENDAFCLIKAIGKNLRKILISDPTNLNLIKVIEKCKNSAKNMDEILINNLNFKSEGLEKIAELFNFNLSKLLIFNCNLNSTASISLLKSIGNNTNIKELGIFNTELGLKDVDSIIEIIKNHQSSLNTLLLGNLKISEDLLSKLIDQLEENKSIIHFGFYGNKSSSNIISKIAKILKSKNNNIEQLSIVFNQVKFWDLECLCEAIEEKNNLSELDFGGEDVKIKSFTRILTARLKDSNSKLNKIHLRIDKKVFNNTNELFKKPFLDAIKEIERIKDINFTMAFFNEEEVNN